MDSAAGADAVAGELGRRRPGRPGELIMAPVGGCGCATPAGRASARARSSRTAWSTPRAASLDELVLHVAIKGFDFEVLDPPELVPVLRALSGRLAPGRSSCMEGRSAGILGR